MSPAKLAIIKLIAELTNRCIDVQNKLSDKPKAYFYHVASQLVGLNGQFQNTSSDVTPAAFDALNKELKEAIAAVAAVNDNASASPAAFEVAQAINAIQQWIAGTAPLSPAPAAIGPLAAATGIHQAAMVPSHLTTMAIGEEKVAFGETLPWGEKIALGESGPFHEKQPLGETGPGPGEGPFTIMESGPGFPWGGGDPFGGFDQ